MLLKYPPLKALRAFESAARTGSYVDAAAELDRAAPDAQSDDGNVTLESGD